MDYTQVLEAFNDAPVSEGMARRIAEALPVAAAVYKQSEDALLTTCVSTPDPAIRNLFATYAAQKGLDRLYLGSSERKIEVFLATGEYSYTVVVTADGVRVKCRPPDREATWHPVLYGDMSEYVARPTGGGA